MELVDVTRVSGDKRHAAADQIRSMRDFVLPDLKWFNSAPCDAHTSLEEGQAEYPICRRCGITFRRHQKVGIAWLYMRGRGLIADQVGTGKTAQAAGLIAACKQNGELDDRRVIVICRASAIDQWCTELHRFLPRLAIVDGTGTKPQRLKTYASGWDILVIGQQMFRCDYEHLEAIPRAVLVVDDVDELRSAKTQTAYAVKRVAADTPRVVVLTGTPLQKRLIELHSICEPLGGRDVFGSVTAFKRNYLREELVKVWNTRIGRYVLTKQTVGYRNLDDFVAKFLPFTLRRTPEHIDDVDLPVITPHDVYLDLHPKQRQKYNELRAGVVKILAGDHSLIKFAKAGVAFGYGQKICSGLATLGEQDGPGASSKLDWIEQQLVDGDLCDEKVVIFAHYTATVEALLNRFKQHRLDAAVIWGRDNNKAHRAEAIRRFWDDPACRVLIGTDAIEQSLNLQVSRHLINVDQLMNPARMTQLAGRIRRDGSSFKTVYVHNLLTRDTQEAAYMEALGREQALTDFVFDEKSQLYEALNPIALLTLIGRTGRLT